MSDSKYAYFCCNGKLYRVLIEKELKLELVFTKLLPTCPALFNHNDIVYSVGGFRSDCSFQMYSFDTINNLDCQTRNFEPMVEPRVIRAENRVYFLSMNRRMFEAMINKDHLLCFQSFDPFTDSFETLPPPPLPTDYVFYPTLMFGHFFLGDYIYLLIIDPKNAKYYELAYTFNIRTSQWKERTSLLDRFKNKQINPPFGHNGDIGLSNEFSNEFFGQTRILVAFCGIQLYAYQVTICADGDLEPVSHRPLDELRYPGFGRSEFETDLTRLADLGGGKFCVFTGSDRVDLLMYVFQIDFEIEYHIQKSGTGVGASSSILYGKKFELGDSIESFCIVSAPPATEDQDMLESTSKRERSGDETVHMTKVLRSL